MGAPDQGHELALVARVRAGDPVATKKFLDVATTTIWRTTSAVVGPRGEAEAALLVVIAALKANGFARLASYDGRSRLSTFLVVVTRDILGEQVAQLFALEPDKAWRRFDLLFGGAIRVLVRRRFPRAQPADQEDLFQEVSASLAAQDGKRIRRYSGTGRFGAYVRTVVDRLLIDIMRKEAVRRRLPAKITRLSELHQQIYEAGAWHGVPLEPDRMLEALRGKIDPLPALTDVKAALEHVLEAIIATRGPDTTIVDQLGEGDASDVASPAPDPEQALIDVEAEAVWERWLERIRLETSALPADQRLYVELLKSTSDPMPPREIARAMAVPVEEIYRLKEQVMRWMRKLLQEVQKNAGASV
jgi:RNA polymerase primary sigma factor